MRTSPPPSASGQSGNTYAPLVAEIRPISGMVVCARCRGRMARGIRTHGRVSWRCQNPNCGQASAISDDILAELVDRRLRELAQTPHLLTDLEPQRTGVDMEAVRLQDELTLALNRGAESPDYVKTLASLLTTAVRAVRLTPEKTVELELVSGGIITAAKRTDFLETVKQRCRFSKWFCGYYHMNQVIDGRFVIQWEQISRID